MNSRPLKSPDTLVPYTEADIAETQSLENYKLFIRARDMVRKTSAAQGQPRPKLILRNLETGEIVSETE